VRGTQRGQPPPCGCPLAVALREQLLDLGPASVDLLQLRLDSASCLARLCGFALGVLELASAHAQLVREELGTKLAGLSLQSSVDVGRLSLALQRTQTAAGLALDIECPVEVRLGALELQLGAPAALPMPSQPGGLLDEEPPVSRLGVDDLLDPALADHRVHLAAEVRVGERLDHVDEPATCPVESILALAVATEPAANGDLGEIIRNRPVSVVQHHLDLRVAARRLALAPGEDHVLHRLAPNRQRALLTEGPKHRVGDVRLAATVRANDHADPRREHEPGALREGLEALHRDGAQVHGNGRRCSG
jgi:hypothetical protein